MRVLQLNLNHCEAAQDLLTQTVREMNIDVAILCEQYRNIVGLQSWVSDATNRAAVWICGNSPVQDVMQVPRDGFTWIKGFGVYFYSVYAAPSASLEEFEELLDRLIDDARERRPLIIAGDFNAWATEWGSRVTNRRGVALLDSLDSLDVCLCNTGASPTFVMNGRSSVVDLTFVCKSLARRIVSWEVSAHYTHSDHQAIVYEVKEQCMLSSPRGRRKAVWNHRTFDRDSFIAMMEGNPEDMLARDSEYIVETVMNRVFDACDASMTKGPRRERRPPVYWWTDEIAELRRECHRTRRLAQRAWSRPNYEFLKKQHLDARRAFTKAIKISKCRCWRELGEEVDADPWGRPYKLVTARLRGMFRRPPTCPVFLGKVVATLFPRQVDMLQPKDCLEDLSEVPAVTLDELSRACGKVQDCKAPGLDGVPNVAIKTAIKTRPDLFLHAYNACIREGNFPRRWKQQQLVLLPKGDKAPTDPAAYRPICLLDTAGKVLERIICNRIESFTEGPQGLSDNQYGFRKARSTVDAIKVVIDIARKAIEGKRWKGGPMKYCAIVTLDVKNAFNTARWSSILSALQTLGVPRYISNLVKSYFKERVLLYETVSGVQSYTVTGGVPQGSVLGPMLWNIMYDAVLKLELPEGARTIGFADDVAIVVVGKYIEQVTQVANEAVAEIRRWLTSVGLQMAAHKTEAVLVTGRKVRESITLNVGGCKISSQLSLRYLGVHIDARLRFDEHLRNVSEKASRMASALARIMPNVGGPGQRSRRLLTSVVNSILLYAAPIWADAMGIQSYARGAKSVHRRSALRVARAFRTVSYDAVCVLADMPPIDLIAQERARLYLRKREGASNWNTITKEERGVTMDQWQRRWEQSSTGRWTFRVIPDIMTWIQREHGELDFYLTQMLTGHGCYRQYQLRFRLDDSSSCPRCFPVIEDVEHVFFHCPRFAVEREELHRLLQEEVTPETIVTRMLLTQEYWSAVATYAAKVLKTLRSEEQLRRRLP